MFWKKDHHVKKYVIVTFIGGCLAVFPILLYKYSWKFFPFLNAFDFAAQFDGQHLTLTPFLTIPLSIFIIFMLVGVIEEVAKNYAVDFIHGHKLTNVDDAIEFSIIAALGFAFTENMLYFYAIISNQGTEYLYSAFIFRSLFSTFAHVLFSGIFGYYWGMSQFSNQIYKKEKKKHFLLRMLQRFTHIKAFKIFEKELVLKGLVIASLLHAFFNIFLEINWMFMMVPYLVFGFMYLKYLLNKKENQVEMVSS